MDWRQFGKAVAEERRAQGMSQPQFAEKSGIGLDTIRKWEQGRGKPRWNEFLRAVMALGWRAPWDDGSGSETSDMTPGLADALKELHIFFGDYPNVLPRSEQTVWKWCKEAGRDAGVERVHPHLFRSTAATRMLVKGARPHAVKDILGHASLRTTQRYWAVEKEDKRAALSML